MAMTRVFQNGNSQAVRLPQEFRLSASEVEIIRRGNELVIREKPRTAADLIAGLADVRLPEDFPDRIPGLPLQEREPL